MKNVLDTGKLEELLIANWTRFLDSSKVMAFCLSNVRDKASSFPVVVSNEMRPTGVRATLSRFHLTPDGFIVWVEFTVPVGDDAQATGTTELHLTFTGDIQHIETLGSLYRKNSHNVQPSD